MDSKILFIYVIPIATILIGTFLSFWSDILKDSTRQKNKPNRPYSFARTQLMWWTLIIISIFSAYYGLHDTLLTLNTTCLALLGISLGTTTGAKIIDNNDLTNKIARHQDANETLGFFQDILSDENGVSVHRFQAFVFNIIYGVIFIHVFCQTGKIEDFGANALYLMGISSTAYVALKMNENTLPIALGQNGSNMGESGTEEGDLPDIDESYYASLIQNDH